MESDILSQGRKSQTLTELRTSTCAASHLTAPGACGAKDRTAERPNNRSPLYILPLSVPNDLPAIPAREVSLLPLGLLPLLLFFFLIFLFPFLLADVMISALTRLGLDPGASLVAALGILLGGMINIPVKRVRRDQPVEYPPWNMFGIGRFMPRNIMQREYTTIAVNVGGCLVPSLLVLYQLIRIAGEGFHLLIAVVGAAAVNIVVCYLFARPVPRVGIALSPLIPALVAVLCGTLFMPSMAPVVAFVSGVSGPLIGADLLNLKKIPDLSTGMASIGGAGTFDGIVISGFLATLLAW